MQAGEFKKGVTFEMDGNLYTVVDTQHVMQPRMVAFVRAKIKNVETGQVVEKRFNTGDRVEDVVIERKEMQYLYSEGDLYYFMDIDTFEQVPFDKETCKEALQYITENMNVTVKLCKDRVLFVEPPIAVELTVTDCEPAVLGDTAKSAFKTAQLETGLNIKVPLFVNKGDKIRVDTRTGEYMERI